MLLIVALVLAAIALSTKTVRTAFPAESLLAVIIVGVLSFVLFQLGRLA